MLLKGQGSGLAFGDNILLDNQIFIMLVQPLPDFISCLGCFYKSQPVYIWFTPV